MRRTFISYSRQDGRWRDDVVKHFQPYVQDGSVELFSDTIIKPGEQWREEITTALQSADAAVLLISPDYLASEFVVKEELPRFKQAFEEDVQPKLYPVFLSACNLGPHAFLGDIQGINRPSAPLDEQSKPEQNRVLADLVRHVVEGLAETKSGKDSGAKQEYKPPFAKPELYRMPALPDPHVPRIDDVRNIRRMVEDVLARKTGPVVISVWGMIALGKTALGTEIAREMEHDYPHQIYVDLNGNSDRPVTVEEAMQEIVSRTERFQGPAKYPEIGKTYQRALRATDGGPLFLFLDNASSNEQIIGSSNGSEISLIPEERHALVLITSRQRLLEHHAEPYALPLFDAEQARTLLRSFVGEDRADTSILDRIADLCGYWPLALDACGSFLRAYKEWTVSEFIDGLERQRVGDDFDKAKQALKTAIARLVETQPDVFRHWIALTLFPGSFDLEAAAVVLGLSQEAAKTILSELYGLSLLLYFDKSGRYEMHRLMRSIANEIAEYPDDVGLKKVVSGADLLAHRDNAANRHAVFFRERLEALEEEYLRAGGKRKAKILEMLHDDWSDIQQGFEQVSSKIQALGTTEHVPPPPLATTAARDCLKYVDAAPNLLYLRQSSSDRREWLDTALRATECLGRDKAARQATYLGALALAYYDEGNRDKAKELQDKQLGTLRQSDDHSSLALALGNLGCTVWAQGNYAEAVRLFCDQFERAQAADDLSCVGYALFNIGAVLWGWCEPRRTPGEATRHLGIARAILEPTGLGASPPQARDAIRMLKERLADYQQQYELAIKMRKHERALHALNNLGSLSWAMGETGEARHRFEDLREQQTRAGETSALARTLNTLGLLYLVIGDLNKAEECQRGAYDIAHDAGDYRGEGASRGNMGIIKLMQGKLREARQEHEADLELAQRIGNLHGIVVAYHNLGAAHWMTGHLSEALRCHKAEHDAAKRFNDRIGSCLACLEIGRVKLAEGNPDAARECQEKTWQEARELNIRTLMKLARARLGNTYLRLGQVHDAERLFQANLVEEVGPVRSARARDFENMGKAKLKAGKFYCSIEYLSAALEIAEEYGDTYRRCSILDNLGRVFRAASRFQLALRQHRLAYRLAAHSDFGFYRSRAQDNVGICLVNLGRFDDALVELHQAYEEADRCGHGYRAQSILYHIGVALRRQGKLDEAMSALQAALDMNTSQYPYLIAEILKEVAVLLIERGHWEMGLKKLERGKKLLLDIGEPGAKQAAGRAEFAVAKALIAKADGLEDPRLSRGRKHAGAAVRALRSLHDPFVGRYAEYYRSWSKQVDEFRQTPQVVGGPVRLSTALSQETLTRIEALLMRNERNGEVFGLYTREQMVGIKGELQEIGAGLKRNDTESVRPVEEALDDASRFSQHDILCIAYIDHLLDDGRHKSAARLRRFFNKHLARSFSHLHILPHFECRSLDNGLSGPASRADGGFELKSYRMDEAYGTPLDLREIDAQLMFDFVPNHLSVESPWFKHYLDGDEEYRDFFCEISVEDVEVDLTKVYRPREHNPTVLFHDANGRIRRLWCTFSETQVDLNIQNPEVLKRLFRALAEDIIAKGASWIRLDAIGYLVKMMGRKGERTTDCFGIPETHNVVKAMNLFLRETAPSVSLVAEVNATDEVLNSYYGRDGNEAHMVYQFPIAPLSLLTIYTQDAKPMLRWAESKCGHPERIGLAFTSSHDGIALSPLKDEPDVCTGHSARDFMVEELKRRGASINSRTVKLWGATDSVPYEACITWLQAVLQHDELDLLTANALDDESLGRIADRFEASQMFALTAPHCVPAEYLGALTGQLNDSDLFAKTNHKRNKNRQQIDSCAFARALKHPKTAYERLVRRIFEMRMRRLQIRRSQSAFSPDAICRPGLVESVSDTKVPVYSLLRRPQKPEEFLLVLVNCTASVQPVDINRDAIGLRKKQGLKDLLSPTLATSKKAGFQIDLKPYQTRWLVAQSGRDHVKH